MSANRIKYSTDGKNYPLYKLTKGRKPLGVGSCHFRGGEEQLNSGITNEYVLSQMKPVARVQSRHRVSKSPRKIPNYQLDIMVDELMRNMVGEPGLPLNFHQYMQKRQSIRQNMPRFR